MKLKQGYELEPRNPFFEMAVSILRHEIDPQAKATFVTQVDLTRVEAIRSHCAAAGVAKPSYTALVVKAVALALKEFPYANRRVVRRLPLLPPRVQRFSNVDLTVAVERRIPGAEMTAFIDVLRDVDEMLLEEVGSRLRKLSEADVANNQQWREFHRLVTRMPHWLASRIVRLPLYFPAMWVRYRGGAAMVSAPGKYGVDTVIVNWWSPIGVSFGVVGNRPVVVEGGVVSRPTFNLTVNFDLRIMAGAQGAQFCRRIIDVLEGADVELAAWLAPAEGEEQPQSTGPAAKR